MEEAILNEVISRKAQSKVTVEQTLGGGAGADCGYGKDFLDRSQQM